MHEDRRQIAEIWAKGCRPARVTKTYRPPVTIELAPGSTAGRPNFAYSYAAQAVKVSVNLVTGQVKVLTVISAHDVGNAIDRERVEGQIYGGVAQALGFALLEHFQARDGHILTRSFTTSGIPTALDLPEDIVPILLEYPDPNGPYGARGVGEIPIVPLAPAIAMAINDATGVWLSALPMLPEHVLAALQQRRSRD